MSKRRDREFLLDIRDAASRALSYTEGMPFDGFVKDGKTQDAVVRNLEIIGEAVKNLSASFRNSNPGIPWKSIAGMRDKIIHQYFGLNLEIIWVVVEKELPILLEKIVQLIPAEKDDLS
jgi:uncharacterized protein with HEPN domain